MPSILPPIESPRRRALRMLAAARRYRLRGFPWVAALYLSKARAARLNYVKGKRLLAARRGV